MNDDLQTDTLSLRKIMLERKIDNVSQLAKQTGLSRATLSPVLKGTAQPSSRVMYSLVTTLNLPDTVAGKIFFKRKLT